MFNHLQPKSKKELKKIIKESSDDLLWKTYLSEPANSFIDKLIMKEFRRRPHSQYYRRLPL